MMVYVDSSVAIAYLLAEDRRPDGRFWSEHSLVASRLLEYEIAIALNRLAVPAAGKQVARELLERVALLELIPDVVERARDPMPVEPRTLDALHLASATFLINEGVELQLATYDKRMREAARKLKIQLYRGL